MVITQLFIGCFMISLTVIIHAIALDRLVVLLEKAGPLSYKIFHLFWKMPMMIITVIMVFLAHIVEIWLWALVFLYIEPNVVNDIETALYFSGSNFTTLGSADLFLEKGWRLLGTFEAANGFMLFGWSTAFIFEIISKLYRDEKIKRH